MKRIIIVGHGFVGKAVDYGFTNPQVEKIIIDPKYGTDLSDLSNLIETDAIFVCLPTPMDKDGSIDSEILESTLTRLKGRITGLDRPKVIVKSTVTPDVLKRVYFRGLVYNPEFLTERSANEQFINPTMHILGGRREDTEVVEKLINEYSLCSPAPVYHMSMSEASFVKYGINAFLALKVLFFNQLYDVVNDDDDSNFARVIKAIGSDPRIGHSHTKVPGFDGKQGFGGACFPKDISALNTFSERFTILEECVTINNNYRKNYVLDDREKSQNISYRETNK